MRRFGHGVRVAGSGGAYIEFPYDKKESFGRTGRVKVACSLDGAEYRGSLVRMGGRFVLPELEGLNPENLK